MVQIILLSVVNFIASMLGVRMSTHPPKTERSKRQCIVTFLGLGICGILLAVWQYKAQEEKESINAAKLDTIQTNQTASIYASERERAATEKAVLASATNPYVAVMNFAERISGKAKERQEVEIINTGKTNDFDWDAVKKEYGRRREEYRLKIEKARLEAQLAAPIQQATEAADRRKREQQRLLIEQITIDECYPYFEYAMTQLKNMLVDWAKKTDGGTNLYWRCPDLRKLIVPDGHCEIELGEKSPWTLDISFADLKPQNVVKRLRIVCMDRNPDSRESQKQVTPGSGGFTYKIAVEMFVCAQYNLAGANVSVSSKTSGESTPFHEDQERLPNYKRIFDTALLTLIAAQDEEIRMKRIRN
jgi:hypothetical protein